MNIFVTLLIALSLAVDSFTVSLCIGIALREFRIRHALRVAIMFSLVQAVMPLIGWFAGTGLRNFTGGYDRWIAFSLLVVTGGKMIWESFEIGGGRNKRYELNPVVLILLALATSIDALAIGVSFAMLETLILRAICVIGVVTFVMSCLGVYVGDKIGHLFENRLECVAGIVLLLIGVKIVAGG